MKTSRKIKIIKILNVLDNVILNALRSYLNHHFQVKIIESKVKIIQQFIWRFRIIQLRITEFNRQFRITQHCPFKLPMQLPASIYKSLSIIIK